ncbi:MAG: hypothetical protein WCX61_00665 [Candidatus Peribacteraceae bacterium]|jgi:hypothetical protein
MADSSSQKKNIDKQYKRFLSVYLNRILALQASFKIMDDALNILSRTRSKEASEFLQKNAEFKKRGKSEYCLLDFDDHIKYEGILEDAYHSTRAKQVIANNLLVALVSEFDVLLRYIVETIIQYKGWSELKVPEVDVQLDKIIEDLEGVTSIKKLSEIKSKFYTRASSGIFASDRKKIFVWLQKSLNLKNEKFVDSSVFIEICERRNAIVHNDGKVSAQYLEQCKKYGCNISKKLKEEDSLDVTYEYFVRSHECVAQIGVALSSLIWLKLLNVTKDDSIDRFLNNEVCVKLLNSKHYSVAFSILNFIRNELVSASDQMRRIFIINLALALKGMRKKLQAIKLINSEDWTAVGLALNLAINVLKENYPTAIKIMKKIGSNGDITKNDYKTWPLFIDIRKERIFLQAYQEVFGEGFKEIEQHSSSQLCLQISNAKDKTLRDVLEKEFQDAALEPKQKAKL